MAWAQEFNISQGSTARPVSKTSPARSYCLHRLPLSLQPFLLASILYPDEAAPSKVTEVFFAKVMAFLVFSSPASPWSTLQHWHPVDIAQHSPPRPHFSHAGQLLHHWGMASVLILLYIWDRVSLTHSDGPWTHSVVQAVLVFGIHLCQPPEGHGWQARIIMPSYINICLFFFFYHFFFPFLPLSSSQPLIHIIPFLHLGNKLSSQSLVRFEASIQ